MLGWRAGNIPLPEAHLAGIASLLVLQRLRPWPLAGSPHARLALGLPLATAGLGLAASAVGAAQSVNLAQPDQLVMSGPYRLMRNPMYAAWTLLHLAAGVVAGSRWTALTLPAAAAVVHREVLAEERVLALTFPADFPRYRGSVPRYVPALRLVGRAHRREIRPSKGRERSADPVSADRRARCARPARPTASSRR